MHSLAELTRNPSVLHGGHTKVQSSSRLRLGGYHLILGLHADGVSGPELWRAMGSEIGTLVSGWPHFCRLLDIQLYE